MEQTKISEDLTGDKIFINELPYDITPLLYTEMQSKSTEKSIDIIFGNLQEKKPS